MPLKLSNQWPVQRACNWNALQAAVPNAMSPDQDCYLLSEDLS